VPNRSSKSRDGNVRAFNLVQQVTGEAKTEPQPEKNPAAVALGRLGGLKGGRARAEKLSAEDRIRIAQQAAKARWKDKNQSKS